MSAIQGSTTPGLTSLPPELKQTTEPVNAKASEKASITEQTAIAKEKANITQQEQESEQGLEQEKKSLTPTQLDKVAQQLQDFVGEMNRGLEFTVDKDSGRDVIKVIDKNSGDLVKQYPSEEVLTLVARLSDSVGGFIDAKV